MTENRCIEVLKKMKHMFTETCAKIDENTALDMAVETIREIQQYRAIGTIEEFKALKEKNEPKKIEKRGYVFVCPICKKWLQSQQENCHGCGQKLAWSE